MCRKLGRDQIGRSRTLPPEALARDGWDHVVVRIPQATAFNAPGFARTSTGLTISTFQGSTLHIIPLFQSQQHIPNFA